MDLFSVVTEWFPYLVEGILVTVGLVASALIIGACLGLPMAIGQVYGSRPLKYVIGLYVWFFRGLPVLVLLFMFYFTIFPLLNLDLDAFFVGATVLGLRGAAYQSQIFRGAIQSISEGQMTAARSLGMSRAAAIRTIIIPQAVRIALPGWSNEYPNILTDSAICYAIGVAELLTRTSQIVTQTYITMPIYILCALMFIMLNFAGMRVIAYLEKRVAIPGFSGGGQAGIV